MYFDNTQALLYMEGHGVYVWSVYAVALVILVALVVAPMLRKRRFVAEELRRIRREGAQRGEGS